MSFALFLLYLLLSQMMQNDFRVHVHYSSVSDLQNCNIAIPTFFLSTLKELK